MEEKLIRDALMLWATIDPIGRTAAGAGQKVAAVNASQAQPETASARRLYYWTARFSTWSASQYMANTTRALQAQQRMGP